MRRTSSAEQQIHRQLDRLARAVWTQMKPSLGHRAEYRLRRAPAVAAGPPTMMTSSPFSAPQVPPVTGASRNSTPRSAQAPATRLPAPAKRCSNLSASFPCAKPRARLRPTRPFERWRIADNGDQHIACAAHLPRCSPPRARFCQPLHPRRVRFHTVTAKPAFNRFAAIGRPIKPKPINPIVGFTLAS